MNQNNNLIWVLLIGGAYLLYQKGKQAGTDKGVQETLPDTCTGVDFKKINSTASQLNQLFGGYMSDGAELSVLAAMSKLKDNCDVLALYNTMGIIDGLFWYNGDLWYQLNRMTEKSRQKVRMYLFSYAKNVN